MFQCDKEIGIWPYRGQDEQRQSVLSVSPVLYFSPETNSGSGIGSQDTTPVDCIPLGSLLFAS